MTKLKLTRWTILTALLLSITSFYSTFGYGQATNTGTIVGVVADQSGAVVPGAIVTLVDTATNASRTTSTNKTGQFAFVDVAPGTYNVTATKSGFELDRIANEVVAVGTQATANFTLHVGNQQTTVEVQAAGTDLQTINATVGSTVDQEAISQLPSLLHDAGTFTTLQPGISPDGSVAGAVVDQSTFSLDGGNNSNDMDGSMSVYTGSFAGDPTGGASGGSSQGLVTSPTGVMPTPADSVEEFKVSSSGQGAEFNNSAGAEVQVSTKRGTNTWHGTGYEYYLDNNFSANYWQNNAADNGVTPPADYHYSKFGFGAGGPVLPKFLGGKTYAFVLYQGWRYPNSEIYTRPVPSAALESGLITDPTTGTQYNLAAIDPRHIGINPTVLAMWKQYEPTGNDATCSDYTSSNPTFCDGVNTQEFKGQLSIPYKDNFLVGRVDHDFGEKWHLMTSYRYYKLTKAVDDQVDIGGFFSGDKLGVAASTASRPQQPWYLVAGLTTNITSKLTSNFVYSFLRNYWSWSDDNAPAQASGLGGALEPFGETTFALSPFNLNTQDIRTRFWDGHDNFLREDLTLIKGNHLFQFGGQYQHNYNYHERSDNGGGVNFTPTYRLGEASDNGIGPNLDLSDFDASGFSSSEGGSRIAAAALGIVTTAQVAYTRSGADLALNPPLTHAFDKSTIPFYNTYFSDTWHMKPSFTLTYGMGWTLEMPPTEATGKQTVLVDASDTPVKTLDYIAQKKAAALQGNVYNPELGFALVGNVGAGQKYPYNPFYGSFSPRVAAAWNPSFDGDSLLGKIFGHGDTVIRGGYGRIYGRLNGVDLVLVPLLGVGLIQPVQCTTALAPTSTSAASCGTGTNTATTAFRIGVDGDTAPLTQPTATLPQPVYPGVNNGESSSAEGLDPNFRPNVSDTFDLTIQRKINSHQTLEVGYIGRLVQHEYQPVNLNVVPYMMVKGGQAFESAYANVEKALGCATSAGACAASVPSPYLANGTTPNPAYNAYINALATQPFFETALTSQYCNGTNASHTAANGDLGTFTNGIGTYASCTAAAVDNELSNFSSQAVWSLWSDMDGGNFQFAPTMMNNSGQASSGFALNASIGHGNYNGGFISLTTQNWHGLLMHNNFTYSKALGTGAVVQASSEYTPNDAFDLNKMYGVQPFNRKFVYNSYMVWQDPYFKGQRGILGRAAGGWSVAPIFVAGNGEPVYCGTLTGGQSFGSADANNYYSNEQCVFTSKYTGGNSSHFGITGGTDSFGHSVGTQVEGAAVGQEINMFKNPVSVWNQVRAPMLGIDTKNPGVGPIIGMPYWNVDMSVQKNFKVFESTSITLGMIFTNVFNHNVLGDGGMSLGNSSGWGVEGSQLNTPRNIEFGMRASF
ncbi:MAG: carboxypeptidase-like regulatory domain-containing protein [Terracidiphilus sp.]